MRGLAGALREATISATATIHSAWLKNNECLAGGDQTLTDGIRITLHELKSRGSNLHVPNEIVSRSPTYSKSGVVIIDVGLR